MDHKNVYSARMRQICSLKKLPRKVFFLIKFQINTEKQFFKNFLIKDVVAEKGSTLTASFTQTQQIACIRPTIYTIVKVENCQALQLMSSQTFGKFKTAPKRFQQTPTVQLNFKALKLTS